MPAAEASAAFLARLAQDHACAVETRDLGVHGTFLRLRDGCGLLLPVELWRQYQNWRVLIR